MPAPKHREDIFVPLSQWIDLESKDAYLIQEQHELILRKTTVAYGILELLRSALRSVHNSSAKDLQGACTVENFAVRLSGEFIEDHDIGRIEGVEMVSPPSSLRMITPYFSSSEFLGEEGKLVGDYLEVEVTPPSLENSSQDTAIDDRIASADEHLLCHSVGALMYGFFMKGTHQDHRDLLEADRRKRGDTPNCSRDEPFQKKIKFSEEDPRISLLDVGLSSSLHLLVDNLLESGCSLETASKDFHLLILDPSSFLFERYNPFQESGEATPSLRVRNDSKLYGREKESSLITDTFCRVASSGESEVLMIGGFSGSGKSRLVEVVSPYVDIADGIVVSQKFDEIQQANPLLVVTSAFNEICIKIKEKSSEDELITISQKLISVFGTNFSILSQVLPNIMLLFPESTQKSAVKHKQDVEINCISISFILPLFMRVVSSKEKPVMMFLDDLQWTDAISLRILADVLTDAKGSGCLFFIGSYRDNEVSSDHPLFDFADKLVSGDVPLKKLSLDGMNSNDLNSMISDSLCMLPRHCKDLSDILHEKTNGSPLFAIELLRSLVDQKLLKFSKEERHWIYDPTHIRSDIVPVTDNVLHLLTTKIMSLPDNIQTSLKVASSFGIFMDEKLVECLSTSSKYSEIDTNLRHAVSGGYIKKIKEKFESGYKFVHDKVREAVYGLMNKNELDQFHYNIGCELLACANQDGQVMGGELLLPITDQINHHVPSLIQSLDSHFDIAQLNYKAGKKAMAHSDFAKAKSYLDTAKLLLPIGHWENQYNFSIQLFFSLGSAAYSCADKGEVQAAYGAIITMARTLDDKLDALFFMNWAQFHFWRNPDKAYKGSLDVLLKVGENVPKSVKEDDLLDIIGRIQTKLKDENDILSMKEVDKKNCTLMRFYQQAANLSPWLNTKHDPFVYAWLNCRLVDISLDHGLSKYSAMGFASLAFILFDKYKSAQDGIRLGKIGLSLQKRFDDPSQIPEFNILYYGAIAHFSEPFQHIAEQLERGMDIGLSIGQSMIALFNGIQHIQKAFFGGKNLSILLNDIEYQLKLSDLHDCETTKNFQLLQQQTIRQLINKEKSNTLSKEKDNVAELGRKEVAIFHQAIQSFWIGHHDRCHYSAAKVSSSSSSKLQGIFVEFYHGLSALHILRKKKKSRKFQWIAKNSLERMKELATLSTHNYLNKAHLLQAEHFSIDENDHAARAAYAASIEASRTSKFVHETGLACEFAGRHCERFDDAESAVNFFIQAKQCYADWGSQMKVDLMECSISRLS